MPLDESAKTRLADAIRALRRERTQQELAKLLGVGQSTVQYWENRKTTPTLDSIEKIAGLRGQLPEEFIAHLYGRVIRGKALSELVGCMSTKELAEVTSAIADRLTEL